MWASLTLQIAYVLLSFLSGRSAVVWLIVGAIVVSNLIQRRSGWMRFIIAVIAASALSGFVRKMGQ